MELARSQRPVPEGCDRIDYERATGHQKAYLSKQFHKKYNTTNLEELTKKFNRTTWAALFLFVREPYNNVDMPTLWPWELERLWHRRHPRDCRTQPLLLQSGPGRQPAALHRQICPGTGHHQRCAGFESPQR